MESLYWKTSEHYFQAQKFVGTPYFEQVRQLETPASAATMGGDRSLPLRPDWRQVKDKFMQKAILAKFQNHQDIRDILLSTGRSVFLRYADPLGLVTDSNQCC